MEYIDRMVIISERIRGDVISRENWDDELRIRDLMRYGAWSNYENRWAEVDGDRKQLIYCSI